MYDNFTIDGPPEGILVYDMMDVDLVSYPCILTMLAATNADTWKEWDNIVALTHRGMITMKRNGVKLPTPWLPHSIL